MTDRFVPVLRFAVCSDTHLQTDCDTASARIARLMDTVYAMADKAPARPGVDAFVFVGDMTDHGRRSQYEAFFRVVNAHRRSDARVLCVAAKNHDNWEFGRDCVKTGLAYLQAISGQKPDFHTVIGGFHFIGISTSRLDGVYYDADQRLWLENELRSACADESGRPVFVFHHEHVTDTVFGSRPEDGWGIPFFRDILERFPRAVHFSGHSHYPLNDPRSVWQGAFTAVGTGALSYAELTVDGSRQVHPDGYKDVAQGWLVEADASGQLRMRGYDFLSGQLLCERFRGAELYPVSTEAPRFLPGAQLRVTRCAERIRVTFPRAASLPGDPVCAYRVCLSRDAEPVAEATVVPPYWQSDPPARHTIDLPPTAGAVVVSVTAENAYGAQSEPIRLRTDD